MGTGISRPDQIPLNESLRRFVSPEVLSSGHPFWNGLLSFHLRTPRTLEGWKQLESSSEELMKLFVVNNMKSGNFGTLLQIFFSRQAELKNSVESESALFVWQIENIYLLLRVCVKFMIERLKEEDVYNQFSAVPPANRIENDLDISSPADSSIDPERRYETFVLTLIDIISTLPISDLTYGLHCDSVSLLTVLLSTPMFSQRPAAQMKSFTIVYSSEQTPVMTKVLIDNFANSLDAPSGFFGDEGGSLVLGLASGVWNILTLGYNSVSSSVENTEGPSKSPLADLSLLLTLVLSNHCTDSSLNCARTALFNCSSTASKTENENGEEENGDAKAIIVDFPKIFAKLCDTLSTDESTLFLYLLVHKNRDFKSHVLASSEIEKVIMPILKTLYHAPESSNHHIYMSLIILLILSEDDLFNTSVHDVRLTKNIDWYTERSLQEISLGGLLILVVIRTIQYNMLKMRDKYLHTNCLAALANMSSQFKNLHPYVSQRIVSMFETLSKKHNRMVTTLQGSESEGLDDDSPLGEALADKMVLEEVLRMILEIINCCLVNQITSNSNLIYTILYKKELFDAYMTHPSFQDLTQNLETITSFFNSKLEQIQEKKERTLAVQEVQEVISQSAMQFPREKLIKFPDLKFKYVEEEQPEEFFLPYVWSLVRKKIFWNAKHIKMTG